MVVSLTISPVRRNENIEGMNRNPELFSITSGFWLTNHMSLFIVLKEKGRTPLSLYNALRGKYLSISAIIEIVLSHCQDMTGYSIFPDLSKKVPSTPNVVTVTPAILFILI